MNLDSVDEGVDGPAAGPEAEVEAGRGCPKVAAEAVLEKSGPEGEGDMGDAGIDDMVVIVESDNDDAEETGKAWKYAARVVKRGEVAGKNKHDPTQNAVGETGHWSVRSRQWRMRARLSGSNEVSLRSKASLVGSNTKLGREDK